MWPDGYYISFNIFTNTFQGALACAYDRAKMIAGQPATQICFQQPNSVASLLPSDLDGIACEPSSREAATVPAATCSTSGSMADATIDRRIATDRACNLLAWRLL